MIYCKNDNNCVCYEDCDECLQNCCSCSKNTEEKQAYPLFDSDEDDEVNQNEIHLKVNDAKSSYDDYDYDIFPSLLEKENKFNPIYWRY